MNERAIVLFWTLVGLKGPALKRAVFSRVCLSG